MKKQIKYQTTDVSYEEYKQQLRKTKHIKITGSGAFSTVYKHALIPNQVLKVGLIHYGPNMDGYVEFVKACQKVNTASGKHNPFLPKVFGVKIFKHSNKAHGQRDGNDWGYYVVTMERLTTISIANACQLEEEIERLLDELDYINKRRQPMIGVYTINKDIIPVAKMLNRLFNRYAKDLHERNFMMRGKQPVIIDPVVSDDTW